MMLSLSLDTNVLLDYICGVVPVQFLAVIRQFIFLHLSKKVTYDPLNTSMFGNKWSSKLETTLILYHFASQKS